jgi:hypothetical protein
MLDALRSRRGRRRRAAVLWLVREHGPTTSGELSRLRRRDVSAELVRLVAEGSVVTGDALLADGTHGRYYRVADQPATDNEGC